MSINTIEPRQLQDWLREGRAVLLDVREPAEHRALRIADARLMPLASVDAGQVPSGEKLVVHCLKGGRGSAACEKLLRQNPGLEIYNLAGGIQGWEAAGLPVIRGKAMLPLDRQVQLAMGSVLILAAALTLAVNSNWAWLTAALGAGLALAGLTGFCGLAYILARMPWNR